MWHPIFNIFIVRASPIPTLNARKRPDGRVQAIQGIHCVFEFSQSKRRFAAHWPCTCWIHPNPLSVKRVSCIHVGQAAPERTWLDDIDAVQSDTTGRAVGVALISTRRRPRRLRQPVRHIEVDCPSIRLARLFKHCSSHIHIISSILSSLLTATPFLLAHRRYSSSLLRGDDQVLVPPVPWLVSSKSGSWPDRHSSLGPSFSTFPGSSTKEEIILSSDKEEEY